MWMLLADDLLGNLESGAFLLMRRLGEDGEELELVHLNLQQPEATQELPLLRGDESVCSDAFGLLIEDLEADDSLFALLDGGMPEGDVALQSPVGWIELDERTLLNLDSNAVLTVSEEDGAFGVVYGTGQGSLVLFAGNRDEADAYLNALAAALGASDALLEAEAESDLREGALGALLSRVRKGQA